MINHRKQVSIFSLLILILLLSTQTILAQRFTTSPYSRFGIGELATQGTARNKAMGGTGIALRDGFFLNTLNPASYTTLDSTTFLFDLGTTGGFTQLESNEAKQNEKQLNLEYFALGFSLKKWWGVSAGVRKVTNVGYDLNFDFENENTGNYNTKYTGSGGINKVYITNAFKLSRNLSIGINTNYNWGKISTTKALRFEGGSQGLPFNSEEELTVSNINVDIGVQYQLEIKEDKTLNLGATFGNKTDLTGDYKAFLYRQHNAYTSDTISYKETDKNTVELPNRFGIGIALNTSKLTVAADAHYQAWGDVATLNTQNTVVSTKMNDSYRLALGMEYTPNKFSGRKFFDRISYRAGLYYENSNLEINGTQLRDYGVTAGLGIPVRSSYMNLALELGTRGTTDNNLVKEKFARISVSFTLFEAWFQKVLYE
ncbi:hypothetical protein C7377_1111 [Balneicella halophila]|uniref:Long-subunit fatty acid transport protein n=1 Tax=Balneicella halophila TaxID=1537566 RepID=A0A7L4UNU6_BALHA|nr:hypothetical protein [Balneicella halophila]PVX50795.1 hypothetical protein C7377_1111 [Balneicella halophila]